MKFRDYLWLYLPQNVYEMANMRPTRTGLVATVHVMSKGGAKHGSRVKVSNVPGTFHPQDNFTVTNEPEPRVIGRCKLKPKDLETIIDWVKLNRSHINLVWETGDDMDPEDVAQGFKKL
ncbi:MAG: hypothetical protein ACYDG4_18145 [Desulfuromonadaceae bacterium]